MQLPVFKTHPDAQLPRRTHAGDLGYDLTSVETITLEAGQRVLFPTGIICHFPEGWGAILKDRSSLAMRGIHALAGVIDNGYRGEVKVLLVNLGDESITLEKGERIAQMMPIPVTDWHIEEQKELDTATSRAEGGFGSSGRH